MIADKKEAIVQLAVKANGRYNDADDEIKSLASQGHISCQLKEHTIKLEIPLIQ